MPSNNQRLLGCSTTRDASGSELLKRKINHCWVLKVSAETANPITV
jgi:hypothetical protein